MTGPGRLRAVRVRLDCVVLITTTVTFVLASVTSLWRLVRLPIGALASTVACFGLAYWGGAVLLDRAADRRLAIAGTVGLQVLAVATFGAVWHLAGGVDNPAFLWAFAPILLANALLLPGWTAYGLAAASWVAATGVALAESEGLRWLAFRFGLPLADLGDFLRLPRDGEAFAGLSTTPSQTAVTLILFAGASLTLVLVADALSRRGGFARPVSATDALDAAAATLFRQAVEADPLPRVIVQPDDGDIVHMSDSFRRQMLVDGPRANLFDVVRFAEADDPRCLLAGDEAEVQRCRYGIGPENRVARLRAHRILRGIEPLVVMTFEELLSAQPGPAVPAEAAEAGEPPC